MWCPPGGQRKTANPNRGTRHLASTPKKGGGGLVLGQATPTPLGVPCHTNPIFPIFNAGFNFQRFVQFFFEKKLNLKKGPPLTFPQTFVRTKMQGAPRPAQAWGTRGRQNPGRSQTPRSRSGFWPG